MRLPRRRRLWAHLQAAFVDRLFALREFLDDSDWRPHRHRSTLQMRLEELEVRRVPTVHPLPLPVIATGAGPGDPPYVRAFDGETAELNFAVQPFGPTITGGIRVAMADFNADGYPDVAAAPGFGGPAQVKTLDGQTGQELAGALGSFLAFGPGVDGGVWLAAGDVNGDGRADLIASAAAGGDRIKVFSGTDGSLLANWTVGNQVSLGGARVAAADLNNDGKAEIITAAGPGAPAMVRVHNGLTGATLNGPLGGFLAYGGGFDGGVFVAAGDTTGDGTPDIITGRGNGAPLVRIFNGTDFSPVLSFLAFGPGHDTGVRVASAYLELEVHAEIIVTAGPGTLPRVKAFDGAAAQPFEGPAGNFLSGPIGNLGGLFVAAANDPPTISFVLSGFSFSEGAGSGVLGVQLSQTAADTVTVDFITADGTAVAGSDYTSANGTLTFAPGTQVRNITVTLTNDLADEPDETFTVTLSNASGGTIAGTNPVTVTITDDDPQPQVVLTPPTIPREEGAGQAVLLVSLTNPSSSTVTVQYSTGDITAEAGEDYGSESGTFTFDPGETLETITVLIEDDAETEFSETFNVSISNPTNATLSTSKLATVTILDNEPTVQFSAVAYSADEGGGTALVTATLSHSSVHTVTVDFATSNGTAVAGTDYTSKSVTPLTFTPGQTAKGVTVALTEDELDESDETFRVTLSNENAAWLGTPDVATVTILDNDPPPNVHFSAATLSVDEDEGPFNVTVTLSAASGLTVTVRYATSDGPATGTDMIGDDYSIEVGIVTFAPGQTTKLVPMMIHDDVWDEANETFNIKLSQPSNAVIDDPSAMTITILDDDGVTPTVRFSGPVTATVEGAGVVTLTVLLSTSTLDTVTVNYATANGSAEEPGDYTQTNGTLTFLPGQTSKTVTVSVADDSVVNEFMETFKVTLSNVTNATLGTPNPARVLVLDNDFDLEALLAELGATCGCPVNGGSQPNPNPVPQVKNVTTFPVRYFDGVVQLASSDLGSDAFG